MKYIIFNEVNGVAFFPVMFPEVVTHNEIGEKFGGNKNVYSAGYCHLSIVNSVPHIIPKTNLAYSYRNKPPQPIDEDILTNALNF